MGIEPPTLLELAPMMVGCRWKTKRAEVEIQRVVGRNTENEDGDI